jgi:2-keto-4-pentenoate hydratase/2-oxohepta-3-ene-1,7-dioic acid hydratase in catechol pathway
MRLLTYIENYEYRLGIVTDRGVVPAPLLAEAFFRRGLEALPELREARLHNHPVMDRDKLKLGPAVPNPGKILCIGLNYRQHAIESGMALPEYPVLFSKFNNALAADGEDVPVSRDWEQVDYESELAVIIGKTAKNVSEDAALDYVLGYCCANDLSERALQFRSGQWLLGKSLDKFLPLGPMIVTADEVGDPQKLSIKGWYNGELRQNSSTSDMIFSVAQVIAYASQYMTLSPGDVISTGTPEGVILGMKEKKFMKPGDEYVVEVEKLGRLSNKLVEA